jgi:alkanesulfonate monooxygenase SsuD/methylene tetrahydromethanopterin reductase-like flavin-dependent oxidoreductase (luciferase family)
MRFGAAVGNDPITIRQEARLLEDRGFDTIWFPEVPLIGYGDPYSCMALAATASERIRLGTCVTPAGMRPAPMLLTHFATINRLAPGRVRIGWASGSFSRILLAMDRLKVFELREELAVLRALRDERTAAVAGTRIRFHRWERECLNFDDPLPLEVGAQGPRTAALAGELGDALVTAGVGHPEQLRALYDAAVAAAREAGRPIETFGFTAELGPLCVLRPGESLETARVIASVQPIVSGHFAFFLLARADPDQVDPGSREGYAAFLAWAREKYGTDPDEQFRALCDRYIGRNPEHDRFVTPGVVESHTLTGAPEAIAERLQEIGRAGVTDVVVLRGLDRPWSDDESLADLVALMERTG